MAAHASEGPVAVHDSAPPPAPAGKAEHTAGGATKPKEEDAPAPDNDDEDGGVWDSASLYEEILDEVEAFEYSNDGKFDPVWRWPQPLTVVQAKMCALLTRRADCASDCTRLAPASSSWKTSPARR